MQATEAKSQSPPSIHGTGREGPKERQSAFKAVCSTKESARSKVVIRSREEVKGNEGNEEK